MKRFLILAAGILLFSSHALAQQRVIDATDNTPVSAASIFDASGNMAGITGSDGTITGIPESAYPITIRCIGYEQLVIEQAEEKTWEMIPAAYELEEVVVVPAERNVLKQIFYVREYFSMCNSTDTTTFFIEHMADRFVAASKKAKFNGSSSLRILDSHQYSRYKIDGKDSLASSDESDFPSMLTILGDLNDKEIRAPQSFKEGESTVKLHEIPGICGMSVIQKQNDYTFTTIVDGLADEKEHKISPFALKVFGLGMEIYQLYCTQAYNINDEGVYLPCDLTEASFVMEANGTGKLIRKIFSSSTPVTIRSMVEMYIVDRDYLTKDEAKKQSKIKPSDVKFVIPSSVPPLNEATRKMVEMANAAKNK